MTAAVLAAVLCFLSYNFFFLEPRFTFFIGARQGVATVLLFLIAALVAGRLASRLRAQVMALRAVNAHTTALQALSRQLANAADAGQVSKAGRDAIRRALGAEAIIHFGEQQLDNDHLLGVDEKGRAAADWARANGLPAGRFTDTLSASEWWLLPLVAEGRSDGVVALRFAATERLGEEQRRLAEAMTEEIAQAVVRTQLVADLEDARVTGETERLRSALLSSVSHDLRSPLAAIIGAASSLDNYSEGMSPEDRHSLLETVRLEGGRLDRYIQNLLDMTRLGHGGLTLNRDWIGVDELMGSATARLMRYQPAAQFDLRIDDGLAPLWVHPALIEQALFNVLENAAKFSPPDEPVTVTARDVDGQLRIDVRDHGPGIPEDERKRIFDLFYSVERGDRGREGTGLGLTISQGMIGAHGGSIEALPGLGGRGTTIRITLPRGTPEASTA
jgi:two-component system sensor histidine kinase KdpD